MTDNVPVDAFAFDTDELVYAEAGDDFRAGVRSYDAAVVGRIRPSIDGDRLFVADVAPSSFDVSGTVVAMYRALEELERTGTVRTTPFRCVCGAHACAYIRWRLERLEEASEPTVRIAMETLAGDPLGDHRYDVGYAALRGAVADLAADVVEVLEAADATSTTAGTVGEFREWETRLRGESSIASQRDSASRTEPDPF